MTSMPELSVQMQALLKEAYDLGHAAGYEAGRKETRDRLREAIKVLDMDAAETFTMVSNARDSSTDAPKETRGKAPKGSVEPIVEGALHFNPAGMSSENIVRWGVNNKNIQVSEGSVRNVLRKLEEEGKVIKDGTLWKAVYLAPSGLGMVGDNTKPPYEGISG